MARDRVPPHDLEAERLILSCFCFEPVKAAQAALGVIEPADFYLPAHRLIYAVLIDLVEQGVKPDPVTVVDELKARGQLAECGGPGGVAESTFQLGGFTANMPKYASIVSNMANRRRLIEVGSTVSELGWDYHESAEGAQRALEAVKEVVDATNSRVHIRDMATMINDYLDVLERREQGEGLGIPMGWRDLDDITQGMREGELIVVGARPGVGKSTFAGNLAVNALRLGKRVLLVSVEMAETEIIERIMAAEARINLKRLRAGDFTLDHWAQINEGAARLEVLPLSILDDPNATIEQVRAAAMRTQAELIIIDYTQLMKTEQARGSTREREVADLTGGFKRLAREMKCPVVALSQVKREADDRRPELGDMAESSSFEKNANVVLGLYREELVTGGAPGVMEVIVIKSRNTTTGTAKLAYIGHHQRISDMAPAPADDRAFASYR